MSIINLADMNDIDQFRGADYDTVPINGMPYMNCRMCEGPSPHPTLGSLIMTPCCSCCFYGQLMSSLPKQICPSRQLECVGCCLAFPLAPCFHGILNRRKVLENVGYGHLPKDTARECLCSLCCFPFVFQQEQILFQQAIAYKKLNPRAGPAAAAATDGIKERLLASQDMER